MNKANPPDNFLRLRDTPDSYGQASQGIRVNSAGTGLEFSAAVAVASLPAGTLGAIACVNNGTGGLAWGATVTGGGSTKYLVWYNGTNWTVAGK
jgi:hypothetical protein